MDDSTGMEARRMLRAGEAVRADDVRRPIVVTKGQTVTMTFEAPGVQLTAMGRAMSEGGVGDTVTVQNPVSYPHDHRHRHRRRHRARRRRLAVIAHQSQRHQP